MVHANAYWGQAGDQVHDFSSETFGPGVFLTSEFYREFMVQIRVLFCFVLLTFIYLFTYLFIHFGYCRVLVTAHGIFLAACGIFSCGMAGS